MYDNLTIKGSMKCWSSSYGYLMFSSFTFNWDPQDYYLFIDLIFSFYTYLRKSSFWKNLTVTGEPRSSCIRFYTLEPETQMTWVRSFKTWTK